MKEYCYQNLKITSERGIFHGVGARILVMEGRISNENSHLFSSDMEREWCDGVFNAIADMNGLECINSGGLASILFMIEKCSENGGSFLIAGRNPYIQKIVELTGVNEQVRFFSSFAEAGNFFRSGSDMEIRSGLKRSTSVFSLSAMQALLF
ncbi:MAG TPA: STAS domain-containing protein [Leptospiraceae bacterium]|nr:STAS domain-containing protein [Leptospiraceae bacterium]